ncbi:MAG: MFS transporter [Chloroflexota bacterium]
MKHQSWLSNFSWPPALQYRDYRLLWIGLFISTIGTQMQLVAVNWHVFDLLRGQTFTINLFGRTIDLGAEALGLGTLGLVRVIPIVLFALLGGMLADTHNRRTLLIRAQVVSGLIAGVLAILTITGHVTVPVIYLATSGLAAVAAFANPSQQSLVPHLVPPEHFQNAVTLNNLLFTTAGIVGPAVAGLMVAYLDIGIVYAINAISFVAVVISLMMLSYRGQPAVNAKGLGWDALIEGLRFTFRTKIIWSTMVLDFLATFFSSARTMLPIIATDILGLGAVGYGWLSAAQPVGSVVAASALATRRDMNHQGTVLLVSVIIYGIATAFLGLSTSVILSFILLALTGAGDTVSTVIRGTVRQMMTPDELRGRMTSVNMMFFMGGPQLGELEAGLVAAVWGVPFAIVTGGLATVLITGLIAWKYPELRQYDSPEAAPAPG